MSFKANLLAAIILLEGSYLPSADAMEYRLIRCIKIFSVVPNEMSVPSIAETYTKDALRTLSRFRTTNLQDYEFAPGSQAVTASDTSSAWAKQKVASRISAILKEAKTMSTETEGTSTKIFGIVFEGKENIKAELNRRAQVADEYSQNNQSVLFESKIVAGIIAAFGVVGVTSVLIPTFACALLPLAVVPQVAEAIARSSCLYHFGGNDEKSLENGLKNQRLWLYQSFDQKVDKSFASRFPHTGSIEEGDWNTFYYNTLSPRLVDTYMAGGFFTKLPSPTNETWSRADELLTYDASRGQHILIDIIRVADSIPRYPRVVPEQKPLFEPIPALVPALAPSKRPSPR